MAAFPEYAGKTGFPNLGKRRLINVPSSARTCAGSIYSERQDFFLDSPKEIDHSVPNSLRGRLLGVGSPSSFASAASDEVADKDSDVSTLIYSMYAGLILGTPLGGLGFSFEAFLPFVLLGLAELARGLDSACC